MSRERWLGVTKRSESLKKSRTRSPTATLLLPLTSTPTPLPLSNGSPTWSSQSAQTEEDSDKSQQTRQISRAYNLNCHIFNVIGIKKTDSIKQQPPKLL